MSDLPAPALGALTPEQDQRLRGYAAGDDRWGWQNVKHSDVAAVMVLFDAQAARLAAQKPVVDAVLSLSTYSRETVDTGMQRIMQALGDYEDWLLEHPNV